MTAAPPTAASVAARITELACLLDGTAIAVLTLTEAGETITLRRDVAPGAGSEPGVPPIPAAEATPSLPVTAPCPGVFLLRHPLREEAGTVLGLLRAGPLLVQVATPVAGTLLAVDAVEGDLVGYGSPLFRFFPEPTVAGMEDP
jgi:acetyl-CoA carboxylase biotin carboxyl carrier protein